VSTPVAFMIVHVNTHDTFTATGYKTNPRHRAGVRTDAVTTSSGTPGPPYHSRSQPREEFRTRDTLTCKSQATLQKGFIKPTWLDFPEIHTHEV